MHGIRNVNVHGYYYRRSDDNVNAYGSKNVYININTFKNILFNFDSFAECCLKIHFTMTNTFRIITAVESSFLVSTLTRCSRTSINTLSVVLSKPSAIFLSLNRSNTELLILRLGSPGKTRPSTTSGRHLDKKYV